mmetsp:Transcript_2772/g.5314  ORF Transcript_2772/g.5314 Transcript_2772/m.5314 type:complete len:1214 (-) Transcript_2772:1308-4949(-)|eukprot:CAMPEP_0203749576 /NCGR_PEP_ID=MMETSP0098-20131031/4082_1 /ASSEMBLY_ACC=CAM_ASM_000208 /TAXON_ID=96639 /ORGANISM=" , Strain NY0313808BC1" /LENGTH=1213 /DNA_ID=CAMNT_0050638651 /DNA_START=300 /DNA_END=3941 /DNA_ORIENTATION=-
MDEKGRVGVSLTSSGDGFDQDIYQPENRDKFEGYNRQIKEIDELDREEEEARRRDRHLVDTDEVKGASHPAFRAAAVAGNSKQDDTVLKAGTRVADTESEYHKQRYDRGVDVRGEDSSYRERMEKQLVEKERERVTEAVVSKKDLDEFEKPQDKAAAAAPERKRRRRWDDSGVSATEADVSSSDIEGGAGKVSRGRRRWDETPVETPAAKTPSEGPTQTGNVNLDRWERDISMRNQPLSDADLDSMLPSDGYRILPAPPGYVPIRKPKRDLLAAPSSDESKGFTVTNEESTGIVADVSEMEQMATVDGAQLPMKQDDMVHFAKLMEDADEKNLKPEEVKERQIMKLLLRIKNGAPQQRKSAMRQITIKARDFGAGPLFNQILPILMSPTLEEQERHLLVKVIDKILYRLDDLVRPYVHKILVVIEPMLIDKDYYARIEAREIIANLSKAAGFPTMIATMRPDIDHENEFVRNTTARAFAVVASALGIPTMIPFLKAVCQSRKSWHARHTGIKIVQQISILVGCAILPHLTSLVKIVEHGLTDKQPKVRMITALALASLAESAHPYGIESFDSVLEPLWRGIRQHQGKGLAAFLKAIGYIIPLMEDDEYASYFTKQVMSILIREFHSHDEEMRKIVLKVVQQCISTDGVKAEYIRTDVCPEFFRSFWVRRMALDHKNYKQLVETTVEIANRIGAADTIERIVNDLKDENEPYRRMVMEAISQILQNLGASDLSIELEQRLVDGALFAFQEQGAAAVAAATAAALADASGMSDGNNSYFQERHNAVMLDGFGTIVNALGTRSRPYIPQICGTIKFRLHNKDAQVRMQAADLVARIAGVMKVCEEEQLMGHLGVVLYEYLGEEYPEVLGSILGALRGIVNVIGMGEMTPPIKDLLPRLTPILRNRHEKVQENCIDLVGRIADRGAEFVSAREWMRICFELIELLRAKKKSVRRAAVNTFGYIAKAIGPQDVLHTLLNNLKVQDRQMRVCTTIAIAIVAESCGPFTVLPALMNEYRVTDINVQNGVLKAISFLFEYIGELGKDYIYSVVTLLEDALMNRDTTHRQTACTAIKHIALGVQGQGCDDALVHLLNFVWPNIFETSPHLIGAVLDAVEGLRVSLGPARILLYVLQGLFHPARRVREVFWKVYNNLYVYGADALTPAYPRLEPDYYLPDVEKTEEDDALSIRKKQQIKLLSEAPEKRRVRNLYQRTHLDLFI